MDFLLYLSPQGMEIYNMISKKIRVVENTPICQKYDIYGWYQNTSKTMVFCTNRIVSKGKPDYDVNETLFHESVHVAQACKQNMKEIFPLGISSFSMTLPKNKSKDLLKTIQISGKHIALIEKEAFWMEDKPSKVKYVVQKYCF
jgi:hypothetical protein